MVNISNINEFKKRPLPPLLQLIIENEKRSKDIIRLVASENLPRLMSRLPYMLDLYARYSFSGEHDDTTGYFPQLNLKEIELKTKEYMSQLLGAKYVNIRPISGMNAMITAIAALSKKNRLVLTMGTEGGGHGETKSILQTLGLKGQSIPFNKTNWEIDLTKLSSANWLNQVSLVYLDLCMVLFPQPIEKLRAILPKDAIIVYDASHVLGLICGEEFQRPLEEGADVLIGSTHKTFPGPHKGIIATNRRLLDLKLDSTSYHFTSHHHIADVACLGLVAENGKDYFLNYAKKTIENAKYLGKLLEEKGINVQFSEKGYTQTHQIWLDIGSAKEVNRVTSSLEELGIILNSLNIPSLSGSLGIRIGTQEITYNKIDKDGLVLLADVIAGIAKPEVFCKIQLNQKILELKNHYFKSKNSHYYNERQYVLNQLGLLL